MVQERVICFHQKRSGVRKLVLVVATGILCLVATYDIISSYVPKINNRSKDTCLLEM